MNMWEQDNLMTHLAAMALYVDQYETDISDFKDDLRLEANKTIGYFRELGCRVGALSAKERDAQRLSAVEAKTKKVARLQIPLEFPKTARGGGSRRGRR
jgi:DNA-directed RNA polymerase I subunit RPA49